MHPHSLKIFEIEDIVKMNLDLVEFIQVIICLKNEGWGICNKP